MSSAGCGAGTLVWVASVHRSRWAPHPDHQWIQTLLTAAQIDQVAAYVASLQTRRGSAGASLPTARGPERVGLRGDPAEGERLFYEGARSQCGGCHSIGGRGGRVGPDLQESGARMSPRDLFRRIIVVPHQATSAAYALTQLRTRGGHLWTGVRAGEKENLVHFYDTRTSPPVPILVQKSEIVESRLRTGSVMPADYASRLTLQQLLDIVAFLKSSSGSKSSVTLAEVLR